MTLKTLEDESGHTLIETLVAMALFTSVLIPLGASLGNLMLDKSHIRLHHALECAESEMDRCAAERQFVGSTSHEGEFTVETVPRSLQNIVEMTVTVYSNKEPAKVLVRLTRSFLDYQ